MGCVIPTSLSVCASECEAFCSRIVVCFVGGWLRFGLCGLSFFFCLLWLGVCHATHELYSDRFSQRRGNSMSMRSCQRRGVGFLPRFSVLMWCWLARDGLFIVVYLRKCWKFFFSMCFPNRWFVCIMRTCMLMCVFSMQSSCVIFPPRSESMCRRLLATRGQFLAQQFGYVVFFCASLETFRMVWCLFRACTDFPNTWFPCLCLVWMIIRFIPQSGACYGVKLESMRCTLWQSGKWRHLW